MATDYTETPTPEHDRLVLWIHKNLAELLQVDSSSVPWTEWELANVRSITGRPLPPRMAMVSDGESLPAPIPVRDLLVTWEHELVASVPGRGERVVGYIDLAVKPRPRSLVRDESGTLMAGRLTPPHFIFFEAKPRIPSIGALLRQLRRYRRADAEAKIFVVSPDGEASYSQLLEHQGFPVLVVPSLETIMAEPLWSPTNAVWSPAHGE